MNESDIEIKTYPLMPLRDIVVFPHMVAPLVVGRQKSIKALESAMSKKTEIFLVTQKDANEDDPQPLVQDVETLSYDQLTVGKTYSLVVTQAKICQIGQITQLNRDTPTQLVVK